MPEIKIIGTSHISRASAREIRATYDSFQPDVIAIELDRRRLHSLQSKDKKQTLPLSMIRQVGATGYLFLVVGKWLQKKLAGIVKVEPGIDMLTAIDVAKENKKRLLLVDQDVLVTMKHLRKAFTFKQKMRMVWDVISSPFRREKVSIKLDKVPSQKQIRMLMGLMQKRYPGLFKALVTDRNVYMCVRLDAYARQHQEEKILLVVGAGHEEDIRNRLNTTELFTVT